jgi:hypothetical protein
VNQGPQGEPGAPGMQGQRGRPGAPGTPGISAGARHAAVGLLVLVLIVGGANLWASYDQVQSFKNQLHAQQVAEQKAGELELAELCATFGKVALLKPPAGSAKANPSRAYEQEMHADLSGVPSDLRCR